MASQNDVVWLALHAGDLTRQQLDKLDLSMLRSFRPVGMSYSVEMWKPADAVGPEGRESNDGSGFIDALNRAAIALYSTEKDGS